MSIPRMTKEEAFETRFSEVVIDPMEFPFETAGQKYSDGSWVILKRDRIGKALLGRVKVTRKPPPKAPEEKKRGKK